MEKETIPGFDIEKRELTEEEASREISLERFQEWHQEIGEDFVDQVAYIINAKIFCGFLLAKYPDWNKEILENVNDTHFDSQDLLKVFEDKFEYEEASDKFYTELSNFANLTVHLKKNLNQVLIQCLE